MATSTPATNARMRRAHLIRTLGMRWHASSFPPKDAPYDDFAVHIRCNDVLARGIAGYGILPIGAIAALIPPEARTVGLVTQDWDSLCKPGKSCACQCKTIVKAAAEVMERERDVKVTVRADFQVCSRSQQQQRDAYEHFIRPTTVQTST